MLFHLSYGGIRFRATSGTRDAEFGGIYESNQNLPWRGLEPRKFTRAPSERAPAALPVQLPHGLFSFPRDDLSPHFQYDYSVFRLLDLRRVPTPQNLPDDFHNIFALDAQTGTPCFSAPLEAFSFTHSRFATAGLFVAT